MQRYHDYERKMLKLRKVRDFLYRFRVLILSLLTLIIATSSTLLGINGYIYNFETLENSYEYGETIKDPKASAIFKNVDYLYRIKGDTNWSKVKPRKVGKYEYKAVSRGSFNNEINNGIYTFEIKKAPLNISIIDDDLIYGNLPKLDVKGLKYQDKIKDYSINFETLKESKNKFSIDEKSLKILDYNNEEVTGCYDVKINDAFIKLLKRSITVDLLGAIKEYDGIPLKNEKHIIRNGSLAFEDRLAIPKSLEITTPGSLLNKRDIKIINKDGVDVTSLYSIVTDAEMLTVTKRYLEIQSNSLSKIYDGDDIPLTYEIRNGSLLSNHELVVNFDNLHVNEPVYYLDNTFTCEIFDKNTKENVSEFYDIHLYSGFLNIEPRTIKIKTGSDSKVYDSDEFYCGDYKITEGELVKDHKLKLLSKEIQIDAGEYTNYLNFDVVDGNDNSKLHCYYINYDYGKLTITPRDLNVTIQPKEKVYDGYPLYGDSYTIEGLAHRDKESLTNYQSLTKVGILDNWPFSVDVYRDSYYYCTQSYNITYTGYKNALKVTPRKLDIKTLSASKVYDGTPLKREEYEFINDTSLADTDHIEIIKYSEITLAGSTSNLLDVTIYNQDNEDVTKCYEINIDYGTLTVEKMELHIKPMDTVKIYDDTKYVYTQILTQETLPSGHTIKAECESDIVEVGEGNINIIEKTITIFNEKNEDVTSSFIIYVESGKVTINPRDLEIVAESITKAYDGTPLIASKFTYVQRSLCTGHSLEATVEGQVNVPEESPGVSKVTSYKITRNSNGEDVTKNYKVTTRDGELNLYYKTIDIDSNNASKTYDGTPLEYSQYLIYDETLLAPGHKIIPTFDKLEPIINVSDSQINSYTAKVINEEGEDISSLYKLNCRYGSLTINPVRLEIYGLSKTVTFNYKFHQIGCADYIEVNKNSRPFFVKEDLPTGFHLKIKGSVNAQEPSFYGCDYNYVLTLDDSLDILEENYSISLNCYLKIEPINITIESKSGRKIYDGMPFGNDFFISRGNLFEGHKLKDYSVDMYYDIGIYENVIHQGIIVDEDENDVTRFYNIQLIYGTIEIYDDLAKGNNYE